VKILDEVRQRYGFALVGCVVMPEHNHKKKIEKLNYMHMNPVKRALVTRPKDLPWSSYSFYASGDAPV
jgi:hypothetical protein